MPELTARLTRPLAAFPALQPADEGRWANGAAALLSVPAGFGFSPSFNLYRTPTGANLTSLDIATLKPAISKTYYVDPNNGVDAAAGTVGAPLKSLSVALAKADVDAVEIVGLTADKIVRSTESWNGTNLARSVYVRNATGYRYIVSFASGTLPTWSVNGTYADVYESTTTAPTQMIDCAVKTVPAHPRTGAPLTTVPSMFDVAMAVASVQAVHDAVGSAWYHDGTKLYYKTSTGRAPDGSVVKSIAGANGRAGGTSGITVYCENIDFVGGSSAFNFTTASGPATGTAVFDRCTFQGSGAGNGLSIAGKIAAYVRRCGAYFCGFDGFNYHSQNSDGVTTGTSCTFVEIECISQGCGTRGSTGTSDNASTAHDFCQGIRIGSIYVNADDRVVADTNSAQTWNLGVVAGQALQQTSGRETFAALLNAKMWIDGCDPVTGAGSNPDFTADSGATIYFRNMRAAPSGGAGTYTPY